ncbi:hypothetical protein Bca52824_042664 [Brassica carinata]|uniref:Uncharacterized protein n=1 Tax=Brassica carinata TaxID=52824 RepID=A0A8X7UXJ6_BRACI|nr:hypothetical protein Bca52824_042664 [Brassica carinata]
MTPPPTDLVDQLRHKIDEEAPPPAIVLPPASEPLIVTPFTDSHEVHSTSCSEIDVTIPMLAAANVAPSNSPIMEAIPSQSIIVEDPSSSANEQQIDPTTPPTHNQQQFYRESEIPVTYGKGPGFDVVGEPSGVVTTYVDVKEDGLLCVGI